MQGEESLAEKTARRLIRALEERGVKVEEAYLFGSRARGDWLKTSDIDLVIVSEDFSSMKYIDRLDLLEKIQWEENITPHIEAIPLTRKEFEERIEASIVLRDAKKYWKRIK